jgi:hypothetical protein
MRTDEGDIADVLIGQVQRLPTRKARDPSGHVALLNVDGRIRNAQGRIFLL